MALKVGRQIKWGGSEKTALATVFWEQQLNLYTCSQLIENIAIPSSKQHDSVQFLLYSILIKIVIGFLSVICAQLKNVLLTWTIKWLVLALIQTKQNNVSVHNGTIFHFMQAEHGHTKQKELTGKHMLSCKQTGFN